MNYCIRLSLLLCLCFPLACGADAKKPEATVAKKSIDLSLDGQPLLRTMVTPFEKRGAANREATYKVFTHILDFQGNEPITKGAGGKYTHHRGLFLGWSKTYTPDTEFDTWHMKNCYQQLAQVLEGAEDGPKQVLKIDWCDLKGKPFIEETRTIQVSKGEKDRRVIDFASHLESKVGRIKLRGDLQHAGMQLRLANEVSEHQETTHYLLPEGAQRNDNDEVTGAWWTCCSAVVRDTRYWLIHMTPPDHPGGVPVYSIRAYARFGAFWEPNLDTDKAVDLKFRILVSDQELDRTQCQALYDAYAQSIKQ